MAFFTKNKKFRLGEFERSILARLMKEGLHLYGSGLNTALNSDPDSPSLDDSTSIFADQQLVKNYIEILLIQLIRNNHRKEDRSFASSTRKNQANLLSDKIITFLTANLGGKWTLQQLCS